MPVVEDLNSVAPFSFTDGQTLTTPLLSITRDGSLNGGGGALDILPGTSFGNLDGTTFLDGETGVTPHENVKIDFLGAPAFAFGADFFSPFSGDGIGLEVLGDVVLLDSITGFNSGFFGVVSDVPFTDVNIVGNPGAVTFQELWSADNLSYAIVPEPTSLLSAMLAAACLLGLRRRVG